MYDLTVGCRIKWNENVFSGRYPNAKYEGERTITGVITKESYGEKTGQHTFTIKISTASGEAADVVLDKGTIRRKGRNVYPTCNVIGYPHNYQALRADKHKRGEAARERRHTTTYGRY